MKTTKFLILIVAIWFLWLATQWMPDQSVSIWLQHLIMLWLCVWKRMKQFPVTVHIILHITWTKRRQNGMDSFQCNRCRDDWRWIRNGNIYTGILLMTIWTIGSWEFWNNINAWNESWNSNWVYDVEDGFLDPYLPADMPDEGRLLVQYSGLS